MKSRQGLAGPKTQSQQGYTADLPLSLNLSNSRLSSPCWRPPISIGPSANRLQSCSRRTSSVFRSQTPGSCSKHPIYLPFASAIKWPRISTSCHNCQVSRATDTIERFSSTFAMTCAQQTFLRSGAHYEYSNLLMS